VSLRTKDLRDARRLASEQWLRWEAEFEARRQSNAYRSSARFDLAYADGVGRSKGGANERANARRP
jgi:hypothetical protein